MSTETDIPAAEPAPVKPEDVLEFLKGNKPGGTPLELDEQTKAAVLEAQGAGDAAAPQTEPVARIDTPIDPAWSGQSPTQEKLLRWTLQVPDLGAITVTDLEKQLYLKAVLNDVPVVWDIVLENLGVTVSLQTADNYELDVIFRALREDEDRREIRDPADFTTRLQQYAAAFQVRNFNNTPLERLNFQESRPATIEQAIILLREHRDKYLMRIHHARWQAILTALRIFEVKKKLCTDAALNGDFWKPVS